MNQSSFFILILLLELITPVCWHWFCIRLARKYKCSIHRGSIRKLILLCMLITAKNIICNTISNMTWFSFILNNVELLFYYFYAIHLFGLNKRIVICCLSMESVFYSAFEYVYSFLTMYVLHIIQQDMALKANLFRALSFIIMDAAIFLILFLLSKIEIRYMDSMKENNVFHLLSVVLGLYLGTFFVFSCFQGTESANIFNIGTLVSLICEVIISSYAIKNLSEDVRDKLEFKQKMMCSDTQNQMLRDARTADEYRRKIVHDANNHMVSVGVLLKNKMYQEAYEYVLEFIPELAKARSVDTTDSPLSAMLYQKKKEAEAVGVGFDYFTNIKDVKIPILDASTIIFNMADNAIEYCKKQLPNENMIMFRIFKKDISVIFECYNSCDSEYTIDDGTIATTKQNAPFHGNGLTIIKETAEKNHGVVYIKNYTGAFLITVIFPGEIAVAFPDSKVPKDGTETDIGCI